MYDLRDCIRVRWFLSFLIPRCAGSYLVRILMKCVLGILADNCSVTHVIACKSSKCGWLFLVQRWVSFAFLWFSGAVQRRVFCACYVLWSCMCKMWFMRCLPIAYPECFSCWLVLFVLVKFLPCSQSDSASLCQVAMAELLPKSFACQTGFSFRYTGTGGALVKWQG